MSEKNVVNIIEPRLKATSYGQTYYERLGINIEFTSKEIKNNYHHIKKFMIEHPDYFDQNNIKQVDEAYNYLRSLLSMISYGNDIKKEGIDNTRLQYCAKVNNEKMLENLTEEIGKMVTVEYMELNDDKIIINKLIGPLTEVNAYDNIVCGNFDISFLGDESAIIGVTNNKGQKIYLNEYLADPVKRNLYCSETKEDFRQVFWSYYISQQISVLEKEKLKEKGSSYMKKR